MRNPLKCFSKIQENKINLVALIQCFSPLMVNKSKLGSAGSPFYKSMLPIKEKGHNMIVHSNVDKPLQVFGGYREQ